MLPLLRALIILNIVDLPKPLGPVIIVIPSSFVEIIYQRDYRFEYFVSCSFLHILLAIMGSQIHGKVFINIIPVYIPSDYSHGISQSYHQLQNSPKFG